MGIELARAFVTIRGDASQVVGDVQSARPAIESAVNGLKGLLGGIGIGLGTAAVIGMSREAIRAGTEAINSETRLRAVVAATGDTAAYTADQLMTFAKAMMLNTNVGHEVIEGAMTRLLTFKNVGKAVFLDVMKSAQDMSAAGFGSVEHASFMLGRALEDPVRGMMMLRRQGIIFTDEQKKSVKELVETGYLLKAQGVILAEVNSKFGGAAAARASTMPGRIEAAKSSLAELREELGVRLLPTQLALIELQVKFQVSLNAVVTVVGNLVSTVRSWDVASGGMISKAIMGMTSLVGIWGAYRIAIVAAHGAHKAYLTLLGVGGFIKGMSAAAGAGAAAVGAGGSGGGNDVAQSLLLGVAANKLTPNKLWSWKTSGLQPASAGAEAIAVAPATAGLVSRISTVALRLSLWGAAIGVATALIYRLMYWQEQEAKERAKGVELDAKVKLAVAAHEAAYLRDQYEQDTRAHGLRVRTEESSKEAIAAYNIRNRMSSASTDVYDFSHDKDKFRQPWEVQEYAKQRYGRQAAELAEGVRKAQQEARMFGEEWSDARKKLQEFIDANPGANQAVINQMRRAYEAMDMAKAQKDVDALGRSIRAITEEWTDAEKATEDWARANQGASWAQVRAYKAQQDALRSANIGKELNDMAFKLYGMTQLWTDLETRVQEYARAHNGMSVQEANNYRAMLEAMKPWEKAKAEGLFPEQLKEAAEEQSAKSERRLNAIMQAKNLTPGEREALLLQERAKLGRNMAWTGTVSAGDLGRQIQNALLAPRDMTLEEAKRQSTLLEQIETTLGTIRDQKTGMLK